LRHFATLSRDHARHSGAVIDCGGQARDEVRKVVGFSVADELDKLERLKNSNMISNEEYTRLCARAVQ
jgi:hypothetical protein